MDATQQTALITYLTAAAEWIVAHPREDAESCYRQLHEEQIIVAAIGKDPATIGQSSVPGRLTTKALEKTGADALLKQFTVWYSKATTDAKAEMADILKETNSPNLSYAQVAENLRQAVVDLQSISTLQAKREKTTVGRKDVAAYRAEQAYPEISKIIEQLRTSKVDTETVHNVEITLGVALADGFITTRSSSQLECWGPSGEYRKIKEAIEQLQTSGNVSAAFDVTQSGELDITINNTHHKILPAKAPVTRFVEGGR